MTENPLVNAIEIVRTDQGPPSAGANDLRTVPLSSAGAQPGSAVSAGGVDWTSVRGSFAAGGKLYCGKNDGTFDSRTYSGGSFGAEVKIDPYNDPDWAGIDTGSGNTYDGKVNALYGQMSSVTGMAYSAGKLYYVRSGDANLHWRWFNTDSGIIGSQEFTANGGRDWTGTLGMFAASGKLYFVTKLDGNLNSIGLTSSGPSGPSMVVDSPTLGGNDWRARALFLVAGNQAPANQAPTASYTKNCTDLVCQFDGTGSSDPDGTIATYSWNFGDTTTDTGQVVNHTYTQPGTYSVKLTVADDDGATNTSTTNVVVSSGPPQTGSISFVDSSKRATNTRTPEVSVPGTVQAGDTLVLTAGMGNAASASAPAGWTLKGDETSTSSLRSQVWVRTATAGDAGNSVVVVMDGIHKVTLAITAYRGVNTAAVTATANTDTNTDTHTTPTVTVPGGSWVASFWVDKSSNTAWSTPGTVTRRADAYTSGGGSVTEVVADSNGAHTGSVSGTTATTNSTSARGVNWSIVLAPESGNPPAGNVPPTAMFTQTCTNLVCQFDGSGSSDSDGTIAGYDWSFGGDGTDTGETVNHTFSVAGTYSVALMVTDNEGGTHTSTMDVTVSSGSQTGSVSFVDSSTRATNTRTPEVSVPGSVQAGDTLLLTASMSNATSASAPSGWTLKGDENASSSLRSLVWVKIATSGDAGSSVEVVMDAIHKVTLVITAYRGVNATQVTATANTDASTASHTTPGVTVPGGSWVASFWADKSSNTSWSTPGSVIQRADAYTSGGGSVTEVVADSNGPRSGAVSGTTATSSVSSPRAVNWSIVLPAQ